MKYPKPRERFRFEDLRKLLLPDAPYLRVNVDCGMFPVQNFPLHR